jgi:hypothetical protein
MDSVLSVLRDFLVALAFSWLGVTVEAAEDRATVREPARPAQSCPAGSSACAAPTPSYRTDCEG